MEGFCGSTAAYRSAMPVVLAGPLHPASPNRSGAALNPYAFRVTVQSGDRAISVVPHCAILQPAYGEKKNDTVLLVGDFANGSGRNFWR